MTRLLSAVLAAVLTATAASAAPPAYSSRARTLVQAYCVTCHNGDDAEGGVDFSSVADDATARTKQKLWKRSRDRVAAAEMPPADAAKKPTAAEAAELVEWLSAASTFVDCDPARRDPGPATLRRLTRNEYRNTVRDLLGAHMDPVELNLPQEGGGSHFDNLAAALTMPPTLMEKYFVAAEKVAEKMWGGDWWAGASRKKLMFVEPGSKLPERAAATQVLTRLASRAYRRPATPEDVSRALGFFDRAKAKGATYDEAIKACLKPVLVSPQFLFRVELDRPATGKSPGVPVDAHELAVRLSYFLWSTMPDDALFAAADCGALLSPAGLDAQLKRMLADEKAKALTEDFAAEWLQLDKLDSARPTTEFFPAFNADLRKAMKQEVVALLDHVRKADRPVTDLIDADYTFLNEPLARHYGIPGVSGGKMQKVSLKPDQHRGGVLTAGAVLAMTSHTFRTSPTQRGKYVLEVIFGTPPPPPPANVPPLKEDGKGPKKQAVTFKEQLAQHATEAACAGCHKKIDPLGFALDNYNAVGAWREGTADNPLDVSGVLPTGERVNGAADLKRVMLARKDEFAKNFVAKMLEYALGRELDGPDECAVRDALAGLQKADYRFSAAVAEVVTSVPFRQRRVAGK